MIQKNDYGTIVEYNSEINNQKLEIEKYNGEICVELNDGDYKNESNNFYIELCFEYNEGNFISF